MKQKNGIEMLGIYTGCSWVSRLTNPWSVRPPLEEEKTWHNRIGYLKPTSYRAIAACAVVIGSAFALGGLPGVAVAIISLVALAVLSNIGKKAIIKWCLIDSLDAIADSCIVRTNIQIVQNGENLQWRDSFYRKEVGREMLIDFFNAIKVRFRRTEGRLELFDASNRPVILQQGNSQSVITANACAEKIGLNEPAASPPLPVLVPLKIIVLGARVESDSVEETNGAELKRLMGQNSIKVLEKEGEWVFMQGEKIVRVFLQDNFELDPFAYNTCSIEEDFKVSMTIKVIQQQPCGQSDPIPERHTPQHLYEATSETTDSGSMVMLHADDTGCYYEAAPHGRIYIPDDYVIREVTFGENQKFFMKVGDCQVQVQLDAGAVWRVRKCPITPKSGKHSSESKK